MKLILKVFVVFLLVLLPANAQKQSRFDSLITSGINQIYNIEFEKAEKTFKVVRSEFPKHPAGLFFDAMIYWWQIMLDFDNEEYDEILEDKLDETIDFCEEILDDDPENVDAIFFMGGALGFRGRLSAVRESWFSAALDGKEALPLVYEAYKIDSTNKDVQLGFGIYNYYAAVIPEQYPVVKPFMVFFPGGDKEKGLDQLQIAATQGRYAKYEAQYFLMTLYFKFEKDYRASQFYAERLAKKFPNNPSFKRYFGRNYVGLGNYKAAKPVFEDMIARCRKGERGFSTWVEREASYYLGMYYKINEIQDSAKVYFQRCAELSRELDESNDEESGFLINSILYLGMINDIMGNRDAAVKNYREVLELREYQNSHKTANAYLKNPYRR